MAVKELGKPNYQTCKRLSETGCTKYLKRPKGCKDWSCLYLLGAQDRRPVDSGILIDVDGQRLLAVYETRPGAWEESGNKEEAVRVFKMFAQIECITGIHLIRYGSKGVINFKPDRCYEDRGEYSATPIKAYLWETVGGVQVFSGR